MGSGSKVKPTINTRGMCSTKSLSFCGSIKVFHFQCVKKGTQNVLMVTFKTSLVKFIPGPSHTFLQSRIKVSPIWGIHHFMSPNVMWLLQSVCYNDKALHVRFWLLKSCYPYNFVKSHQASNFTVATEAIACRFWGFALVPSNLNKCNGMLNHVLALVPWRKLSTFHKWPQCPLNLKNLTWGLSPTVSCKRMPHGNLHCIRGHFCRCLFFSKFTSFFIHNFRLFFNRCTLVYSTYFHLLMFTLNIKLAQKAWTFLLLQYFFSSYLLRLTPTLTPFTFRIQVTTAAD